MTQIDGSFDIPDRMLRVFDAAARHGSFSAAARSLDLGQPAVSHAVARLEIAIGARLFNRAATGVSLTNAGRQLHGRVRSCFDEIDRAVTEAMSSTESGEVTLSVSASLAMFWLMPRLQDFKLQNPTVELRVITTDTDRAVGADDADLWIPLGKGDYPGLDSVPLCPERVVPVASPSLADDLRRRGAGLAEAPLLHLEERYIARFDWNRWFQNGQARVADRGGYRSNDYSLILQAALDGQGVALGWMHIVAGLIDENRLVPIGEPVETDEPFVILTRTGSQPRAVVLAMRSWLQKQAPASVQ